MLWYIQLGKGKSVKELSQMPIRLTSKMAHQFKNAPEVFKPNEALRFAQALGFGASLKTARVIGFSKLSMISASEEKFWATVVQFFAKETMLNAKDLDRIIEYLKFTYRENENFSIKNRTQKALLILVSEWERNVYKNEVGNIFFWESSGITPLKVDKIENGKKVVYRTVELLNSMALYDEGKAMHHCVADYDEECKEGLSTIFSLQKTVENELTTRLATIEIGLTDKHIVEAKAKFNEEPDEKSLEMIDVWSKNSQITGSYEVATFENHNDVAELENVGYVNEEFEISARVIFWILYFIIKTILLSR